MNMYAIKVQNITKSYKDGQNQRLILDNLNLNVKPGEFIAIVGPSGSGKSTLLSIIGALLSPDKGKIIINNTELEQHSWTEARRNHIGFIFQNHQLIPYLTVYDQLNMIYKLSKKIEPSSINKLLEVLELQKVKYKFPNQLSGGEKQRVAIARALMNNPEIILADEPTASLDKQRGMQAVNLIATEVKKRNKAAIMVTHDERVLDLVDRIYYLEECKLKLQQ